MVWLLVTALVTNGYECLKEKKEKKINCYTNGIHRPYTLRWFTSISYQLSYLRLQAFL